MPEPLYPIVVGMNAAVYPQARGLVVAVGMAARRLFHQWQRETLPERQRRQCKRHSAGRASEGGGRQLCQAVGNVCY